MQTLTRDELKTMNEVEHEDFVLINVLPKQEFLAKHIRTSVNIPVADDNFSEKVEQITGSKERRVVVYCASYDCDASVKAAEKLDNSGFTRVYDYSGGTKDWFAEAA